MNYSDKIDIQKRILWRIYWLCSELDSDLIGECSVSHIRFGSSVGLSHLPDIRKCVFGDLV